MPIYEYICDDCETRYERLVMRRNGERVTCPKCGSKKATQQYSTFSTGNGSSSASAVKSRKSSGAFCACTPRSCGCH